MGGKKVGGQERIRRGDPHSRPWRGRFASLTGLVSWPHPAPFKETPFDWSALRGFCVSQSATSGGSEEEGKLGGWGQLPGWSLRTAPSCPWPRASSGRRRCCSSGTPGQSTQRSLNFRLPRELRAGLRWGGERKLDVKEGALGFGKGGRGLADSSSSWGPSSLLPSKGTQESPGLPVPVLRQQYPVPSGPTSKPAHKRGGSGIPTGLRTGRSEQKALPGC